MGRAEATKRSSRQARRVRPAPCRPRLPSDNLLRMATAPPLAGPDYSHFGGHHWETVAMRNTLAHSSTRILDDLKARLRAVHAAETKAEKGIAAAIG